MNGDNTLKVHWSFRRIGEICLINPGLSQDDLYLDDVEIQFLPMKLVEEGTGRIRLTETRRFGEVKRGYTAIKDNDVLFAKVTPCMENGKMAIASKLRNGIGFGSTEFHVLRPLGDILNKYLFFFLIQRSFRHEAASKMTGAVGLRRVPKQFLADYKIPIAPLREQSAIVSKIEELFSELDKGIEQLKTARQQLKVYRQAVLKYAFEGRFTNVDVVDGELPEGWTLSEIGSLTSRVTVGHVGPMKNEYINSGVPFLRGQNVRANAFNPNGLKFISIEFHEKLNKSKLQPGDILVVRSGNVGTSCVVPESLGEANCSDLVIIKKPNKANGYYISYYLNSVVQSEVASKKVGVALSHFNTKVVNRFVIPLAPRDEQNGIVQEIESRLSVCDKLEETISNSLSQAEALRQSILKKAFEGKLLSKSELKEIHSVTSSIADAPALSLAAEPKVEYKKARKKETPFPKSIEGIATTDLHAGILGMVIEAHEMSPEHHMKLSHVKGEKIAHMVEAYVGIDLGRNPRKDAAGPDDYPHLMKVESRAKKANWFGVKKLKVGHTYTSKPGMGRIITKVKEMLPKKDLKKIEDLIHTFLPFDLEHAEVIATVYAGWNNLLLEEENPTDEEIVYESRENWSKRKLKIERVSFFKALKWMREHEYVPEGRGKKVHSI